MKGSYADPEVTGVGYNVLITEQGDHLGSTSYITDQDANVTQYDAYLPYGELLVDEHSSSTEMPYKFNGKEFDSETGLYYYGARYMNPITSLWYGVDPLAEKYVNIGGYIYCHNNPICRIDPTGCFDSLNINKNTKVVAVFPQKYEEDMALHYDYDEAKSNDVIGILVVESVDDFRKAMDAVENSGCSPNVVTINSHGIGGKNKKGNPIPAGFRIGNELIGLISSNVNDTEEQAATIKKILDLNSNILKNAVVFIGACNVGKYKELGGELTQFLARAFHTTVITSRHKIMSGYKYDSSKALNHGFFLNPKRNQYLMVTSIDCSVQIVKNVTIGFQNIMYQKEEH